MATSVGYRGPQAVDLAGITYRQLDYWARTGLVQPSIAEAHGSGTQRRYSGTDVACLRLVCALGKLGNLAVNDHRTRAAIAAFRYALPFTEGDQPLLTITTRDVRLLSDPLDIAALAFAVEPTLLVPLAPLLDGLDGVQR